MIKKSFKNFIGSNITGLKYPLVINSYGRSGSTVLTKSIIDNLINSNSNLHINIISKAVSQSAWNLDKTKLSNGVVYKTHSYPPQSISNNNIKMLYTFADPVDVVLSILKQFETRGELWIKEHYNHLDVPYHDISQIIHEDQLKLENHLNIWMEETRFPIAFVRYETMWHHQKEISNYLGFNIELPPFKKRKAKSSVNNEVKKIIEKTYSQLRSTVNELKDFFILN